MKLSEFAPNIGERLFITGNSGSGKSTFASYMARTLAEKQILVIIDPKGEIDTFKDSEVVIHKPTLVKNAKVIRYVPSLDSDVVEECDLIMRSCYNAGNIAIWADEIYAMCEGQTTGANLKGLRAVLTRGRSKKITFMGLAQRPAMLPLFCISESNSQAVFCLPMKNDRERMVEVTGADALIETLPKYQFWFSRTNEPGKASGPYKLDL